jgi:hypothetical protein
MKPGLGQFVAVSGLLALGTNAHAHFALQAPACWMSQDTVGAPLKKGPCGDEGGGTPTAKVTTFQEGQMITVTINETIFHPGHYRIALATTDRSQLPAEPVPTANCGSVPVQTTPVFPVLADGLFTHTTAFTAPQTVQIKLPANVTCTHCTLQVIQFMSNQTPNPTGGCFYHHCADIAIQTAAVPDGGVVTTTPLDMSMMPDGATTPPPSEDMATGGGGGNGNGNGTGGGAGDSPSHPAGTSDMGQAAKSASNGTGFFPGCSLAGATSASAGAWPLLLSGLALVLRRRRSARR